MDHEYVTAAQRAIEGFSKGLIPGAYWVEYFPILRYIPSWVPGANFKKLAEEYVPHVMAATFKPYNEVKEAMVISAPYPHPRTHADPPIWGSKEELHYRHSQTRSLRKLEQNMAAPMMRTFMTRLRRMYLGLHTLVCELLCTLYLTV